MEDTDLLESSTITITFGDQAENHKSMQVIGELAKNGFNLKDLKSAKKKFEKSGCECELICLADYVDMENTSTPEAYVLIIRNGVNAILEPMGANAYDVFLEQRNLVWDSKAKMYGRVVDKHARHNLCYSNYNQEPDYESGKGRIVSFDQIPCTKFIHENLHKFAGELAENLVAEGNLYFDPDSCGIGQHGDEERKKVIALRLGKSMSLYYYWFYNNKHVGEIVKLILNHGDMYIMSENATGYNWKKKLTLTLRHAAGCDKYTTIKAKK